MESGNFNSYSSYHSSGPYQERNFSDIAQNIGTNIQKILQNVSSMKRMVNLLGTAQDSSDTKSQLYQIQHYTQQLAKDTNHILKQLNDTPLPSSPSEQRQCKMQKERLADDFSTALNAFQDVQKLAHKKESDQIKKTKVISKLPPPPGRQAVSGEEFGDRTQDQLIELQDNGSQQLQQQRQQDFINLREAEEQEQAIRQLESDIRDVNQIFKELGAMVHDQGELIDSIEAHVERTEAYVSDGNTQLKDAAMYTYKVRRKKFVCMAVGIVFLLLVLIWMFWPNN
ncbi:syntaxin-12-like [Diaphorina citri]|uniref:Syntaxin-12-like n=1 Tax=Diaphorina citri TaxID=121845 RepID=A0A1S3DB76_DIACI|nr:syntaxin-12-like [Diaphorina citri]